MHDDDAEPASRILLRWGRCLQSYSAINENTPGRETRRFAHSKLYFLIKNFSSFGNTRNAWSVFILKKLDAIFSCNVCHKILFSYTHTTRIGILVKRKPLLINKSLQQNAAVNNSNFSPYCSVQTWQTFSYSWIVHIKQDKPPTLHSQI